MTRLMLSSHRLWPSACRRRAGLNSASMGPSPICRCSPRDRARRPDLARPASPPDGRVFGGLTKVRKRNLMLPGPHLHGTSDALTAPASSAVGQVHWPARDRFSWKAHAPPGSGFVGTVTSAEWSVSKRLKAIPDAVVPSRSTCAPCHRCRMVQQWTLGADSPLTAQGEGHDADTYARPVPARRGRPPDSDQRTAPALGPGQLAAA